MSTCSSGGVCLAHVGTRGAVAHWCGWSRGLPPLWTSAQCCSQGPVPQRRGARARARMRTHTHTHTNKHPHEHAHTRTHTHTHRHMIASFPNDNTMPMHECPRQRTARGAGGVAAFGCAATARGTWRPRGFSGCCRSPTVSAGAAPGAATARRRRCRADRVRGGLGRLALTRARNQGGCRCCYGGAVRRPPVFWGCPQIPEVPQPQSAYPAREAPGPRHHA